MGAGTVEPPKVSGVLHSTTSAARLVPEPIQNWMSSNEIAGDFGDEKNAGQRQRNERDFFHVLIFQFGPPKISGERVLVERPARSLKTKNLQTPAKRRMKAFNEPCRKPFDRLASSFSLTEKSAARTAADRDEHSQTGILTSASNRIPAFPIRFGGTLGICSRYSGATVPDFHRVPRHLTAMTDEQRSSISKNNPFLRSN